MALVGCNTNYFSEFYKRYVPTSARLRLATNCTA
jgi:hypothetical protein